MVGLILLLLVFQSATNRWFIKITGQFLMAKTGQVLLWLRIVKLNEENEPAQQTKEQFWYRVFVSRLHVVGSGGTVANHISMSHQTLPLSWNRYRVDVTIVLEVCNSSVQDVRV